MAHLLSKHWRERSNGSPYRHLIQYDGDSNATLKVRRSVRDALRQIQIAENDIERVLAFFANDIQQIAVPPPPLPPRMSTPDSGSEQSLSAESSRMVAIPRLPQLPSQRAHKSKRPLETAYRVNESLERYPQSAYDSSPFRRTKERSSRVLPTIDVPARPIPNTLATLGPKCRFLILTPFQVEFDLTFVVHAYLEYLRILTACYGGPWIFKSVSKRFLSRGEFPSSWTSGEMSESEGNGFSETDRRFRLVRQFFRDLHGGHNIPGEMDDILRAMMVQGSYRIKPITVDDLNQFDYILVLHKDDGECYQRLPQDYGVTNGQGKKWNDECIKFIDVGVPHNNDVIVDMDGEHVYERVRNFLATEFGWKYPQGAIMDGMSRTRIITISMNRKDEFLDLAIRDVAKDWKSCRIYKITHNSRIEQDVALVAPKEELIAIIDDLKRRVGKYGEVEFMSTLWM